MPERFNPHDSQYKKVEDLPEEIQKNFVNVEGGGFVYKSATDYGYDQAFDDAELILAFKKQYPHVEDYIRHANWELPQLRERRKYQEKKEADLKKFREERLAAIEKIREEREPNIKKIILFIEDDSNNIEAIESLITKFPGREYGDEYIVANSLDEARAYLDTADTIITDRFFPTSSDAEPNDNGLDILTSYPDKTALITSGDTNVNVGDHKWKKSKCITIAYRQEDRERKFETNLQNEEAIVKKRPVDWAIAHNFATGAYQSLEKLSDTDIFKSYYHGNLAGLFSQFACGSPALVEELAIQKILSLGNDAKKQFPLRDFVMRYAFSVAKTNNELVLLMRKFWPQTAESYSSKAFVGMTTSDDPDPSYERVRDNFKKIVNKLFEGTGCQVQMDWESRQRGGGDVSYDLYLNPLYMNLMKDTETADKVEKFREKIESLL
ncbi:MAG: hypothetical protein M0P97_03965 [Candidatus Moranbacteria bacterium]|jgi:hypothetical protein|nr:hypothetical protein [Candidatus Moranbacteria bacterium]